MIDSPRSKVQGNPLDNAAAVPYDWTDPVEHRRKLAEAIQNMASYLRALPAYGGVWREQEASPFTFGVTTSWQILTGYNADRPDKPKRVTTDFNTGLIRLEETGVYFVSVLVVYEGNNNRYIDFGVRVGTTDPAQPAIRQEILTAKGDMVLSYGTLLSFTTAPEDYYLVVKGEVNMNIEFDLGGWSIHRIDYNSPLMAHQRIMG